MVIHVDSKLAKFQLDDSKTIHQELVVLASGKLSTYN